MKLMRHATLIVLTLFAVMPCAAQTAAQTATNDLPSIKLPADVDRVLRDYEKAWQAKDAAALAQLFTEDGFVLSNGKPPVRGRAAIRSAYADGGGPLSLRAYGYAVDGKVGYIVGGYGGTSDGPLDGKFVLALRKDDKGRWLIAADIDNTNRRPRSAAQ